MGGSAAPVLGILDRDKAVGYVLLALAVAAGVVALVRESDLEFLGGLVKVGGKKPDPDAAKAGPAAPRDGYALVQLHINSAVGDGTVAGGAPDRAPGPQTATPGATAGSAATRPVAAVLPSSPSPSNATAPDPTATPLYWRRARPLFEAFNARQRYGMQSFRWTLEITESFDVASETVREIVAVDRPLVAICGARGSNVPCPRFEDLQLAVFEGPEGARHPLLWLPTTDESTSKQFVIFLREPLLPGQGSVLLTVRSVWPRAAERLEQPDDADLQRFVLPKMAQDGIPAPDLRIKLPASRGRFRVTCADPELDVTVPDPVTGATSVPVDVGPSQPGREIRCGSRVANGATAGAVRAG